MAEIAVDWRGVTYKDFLAVAKWSGTEKVPQIRAALERLRREEAA